MKRSTLKKHRLVAGLTQTEVADALKMSQPNYQRWEAGHAPVPKAKLKKLARILKTTVDELLGKPEPFDLLGVDENVKDARKYYGEVAIHFSQGAGILLPISEAERVRLHHQIDSGEGFLNVESLDNRVVFIRSGAITDLYFSSEAYDTFGPEKYSDCLGVLPDDDYWKIVEHIDALEYLEDEIPAQRIAEVRRELVVNSEDVDRLIAEGRIDPKARNAVIEDVATQFEKYAVRADHVEWQLSSGVRRSEYSEEDKRLYEDFELLEIDPSDVNGMLYLPLSGYHRSVYIGKSMLDFISLPKHKFNESKLDSTEEMLDNEGS